MVERLSASSPLLISYYSQFSLPPADSDIEQSGYRSFIKEISKYKKTGGNIRLSSMLNSGRLAQPPLGLREYGYSFSDIVVDSNDFAKDDILRRAVLSFRGEDSLHLWTANKFRESIGLQSLKPADYKGAYYSRESDAIMVHFRYFQSPLEYAGKIEQIPFHMVRVGNFPKDFFKDKIVIIGPSYISNPNDYLLTPFDRENFRGPKIIGHASIIQSLAARKTIYPVSKRWTHLLSIFIVIILSLIISRLKPTNGLLILVGVIIFSLIASYVAFITWGLWIYITPMIISVFVVYYIWVPFRAIGEYQKNFAIQEESKLLKKVENLKQNFISLMSHDLKTPVAKIAGLADNILHSHDSLSIDQEKNVLAIVDSTKELNRFITSILDLTKIESRNLTLNRSSKDLNIIIEGVIDNLKFEAESKKVSVVKSMAPLYPIQVDIVLIQRVISNLIENALKYSGEGSQVDIATWDDEKWVYVSIEDNGVGIPKADASNIFEKFYRIKNDTTHRVKGSGLGLYLVKYFVELHEGEISVESDLGEGTKFLVKLVNK
jgi:signal transduction histidine kinase